MKKIFSRIGFAALICVSFIFTEKTTKFLTENDAIMKRIKEENITLKKDAVDAFISDNTIIPGLSGSVIDEKASYKRIKQIGDYNESLLVFKNVLPKISITRTYDKFVVGGNPGKNYVTLIFLVTNNTDINKVLNVLNEKNIKVNFFVDSIWVENNNDLLLQIIKDGHNVGNLSYNFDYKHSDFGWINSIVNNIGGQKTGFCYSEDKNEEVLKICSSNKKYTITPNLVISKYPSLEVKENLKSGSIISSKINSTLETELNFIINYIYSKGYEIKKMSDFLKE